MPSSPLLRAVRAPRRAPVRRLLHVLALTAVALPLIAVAPAPAGVPVVDVARDPDLPSTPKVVTVVDGLSVRMAVTDAPTVAEVLRELDVALRPLDRVEPEPGTPVDGPLTIGLTRVEVVQQQVEVPLRRAVVRVEDPDLLLGYVHVDRPGRTGLRLETQLVTKVAGEERSRATVVSHTLREPRARVERIGTRTLEGETVWDALARCEASGRWDVVRMAGGRILYSGGLQFAPSTWSEFRPDGFPTHAADATREQQIEVAERVLARQGWGAWPACARRLGLR